MKNSGFNSGTDALLLAAYVIKHLPTCEGFVELGTGKGMIAELLAKAWPQAQGLGLDIQEKAIDHAKKNIQSSALESRLQYKCMDLQKRASLLALQQEYSFLPVSCVVANPPYYAEQTGRRGQDKERELALRQGPETLGVFCKAAQSLLRHHGYFFCIYTAQHMPYILRTLEEHAFGIRSLLPIHSRPQKKAQWVLVGARKNATTDVHIEKALCLYNQEKGQEYHVGAVEFCPWL